MNPISTRTWGLAALGYLGVVVYLTLLPFDFSAPISLADAWARYQTIRFDGSGPRARQQWASNVLMFVPLGFFWAAWALHRVRVVWLQLAGAVLVMGFCLLVTAAVEFFQIWIPNRGPSLSDMSANATGGVIGALGWLVSRIPTVRTAARGLLHRRSGLATWVGVYLAAYVFASLLPLDFILSGRELGVKLSSGQWGWLTAPSGCGWGIRCVVMRGLEIALAVPLGLWLAYRLRAAPAQRFFLALAGGLLLGLVVELGQFMTVSGMAEGASVLLRALGAGLGATFWLLRGYIPWQGIHRQSRWLLLMALPLYLLVLLLLSLAGARGVATSADAMAQLVDLRWLPFYHHYFVPEAQAIQSVLMHMGLYAFMGLGLWLWDLRAWGGPRAVRAAWVAAAAVLVAVLVEGSKLWIMGLRPDISTALLAALSAGGVYVALWWWVFPGSVPSEVPDEPEVAARTDRHPERSATETAQAPAARGRARWPWIIPAALVCVWALSWPAAGLWLALGLAAYGLLLWRRPDAWALVVPAVLPVLFLAPWSGRIFIDEFDLLLLVTVCLLLVHRRVPEHGVALPRGFAWALGLFALSMVLSLLPTLGSLFPLSLNSYVDYTSPWNGLRAAKGLAWALLLYLLLPRSGMTLDALLHRRFVPGMVLGLAGLALILLWERATYPGLFNFSSSYRVTGLFAEMQVGGPSIEAYLLLAMPFLLIWAGQRARLWAWGFALGVLAAALYGLLMTYSRAGYLGLLLMVVLLVPGLWIHGARHRGPGRALWMVGAMVPVLLAVGLWSQVGSGFAGQRMQQVERDLVQRQAL
ncbi:MAG TPA: VanZ family protein, partial [Thioalkalivibrio sp.]|nr:VanZ family protein [Thioalkalivibrio sp.]